MYYIIVVGSVVQHCAGRGRNVRANAPRQWTAADVIAIDGIKGIGNRQWAMGNRQSTIDNRQGGTSGLVGLEKVAAESI